MLPRVRLLVLAVGIVVTGCTFVPPTTIYPVAMSQEDGRPLFSLGCERAGVSTVTVALTGAGSWKIESAALKGSDLSHFTLGTAPAGFDEVRRLRSEWKGGTVFIGFFVRPGTQAVWTSTHFPATAGNQGWSYPGGPNGELIEGTWAEYQEWLLKGGIDAEECRAVSLEPPRP